MGLLGRGFVVGIGATIGAGLVVFMLLIGTALWHRHQQEQAAEAQRMAQQAEAQARRVNTERLAARRCADPEVVTEITLTPGPRAEGRVRNTCDTLLLVEVTVQPIERSGAAVGSPLIRYLTIPSHGDQVFSEALREPSGWRGLEVARLRVATTVLPY